MLQKKHGLLKRINALPKGYIIIQPWQILKNLSKTTAPVADVVEKYDVNFGRGGNVSYREGDPTDLNVVVEFPSLEKTWTASATPNTKQ